MVDFAWLGLKQKVAGCTKCEISRGCNKRVFGAGVTTAPIFLLGEAPGQEEDKVGLPFMGDGGKYLRKALDAAGYKPDDVYVTNVIKCRPPESRKPSKQEISNCSGFLLKQIEIVNPKVVVALGEVAAKLLLPKVTSVSSVRGQVLGGWGRAIVVTWHPSYYLRMQEPDVWRQMVRDLGTARERAYAGRKDDDANP